MNRDSGDALAATAAALLNISVNAVRDASAFKTFTDLGGTSLLGMHLVATAARAHSVRVDLARLLANEPLAVVLHDAEQVSPADMSREATHTGAYPLLPDQSGMLLTEAIRGGSAYHLLFTADLHGDLDVDALVATIGWLTDRHEALRTVVTHTPDGGLRAHVLPTWRPRLLHRHITGAGDPVAAIHAILGSDSGSLLRPFVEPPVCFVLTDVAPGRHLLSLLIHHAFADGWAIGQLWREFADAYAQACTGTLTPEAAPSPGALWGDDARAAETARRRAAELSPIPSALALPADEPRPPGPLAAGHRLRFGLGATARDACERLAAQASVTRTAVMLAAWALTLSRRCGNKEFLIGVPVANRATDQRMRTVTNCARVVPVACRIDDNASPEQLCVAVARGLAHAVSHVDAPLEDLVRAADLAGRVDRHPLIQAAFAAHDELVPAELTAGPLRMVLHEGYCGGAAFDLTLYLQRWTDTPTFALETANGAVGVGDALDLAEAFESVLADLGGAARVGNVRGISAAQLQRLTAWGQGEQTGTPTAGLWDAIIAIAQHDPHALAVRDDQTKITYGELISAATNMSARLWDAGVRPDDHVALDLPRSCEEIVAILAVLRIGAVYCALDPDDPPERRAAMLAALAPRLLLTMDPTPGETQLRVLIDSRDPQDPPPAFPASHQSPLYVAFTSGSTGVPKGVRVPHGAVCRLVDWAAMLPVGPGDRMLRLAPLAFDASTLEIFAPLGHGGTIEIAPAQALSAADVATVLRERTVSVAWLTAGLFRIMAEYELDALAGLRHVLTGGDVVPADAVRAVLARAPGIAVTNGYGPTENTTFTTTYTMCHPVEVPDSVPIGRPVNGTGVVVVDETGELVPPGATGELFVTGAGLALDYLGQPEASATAFTMSGAAAGRAYRTGDIVRWNTAGQLCFLGRRDRQVKLGGHRVELDEVRAALLRASGARDAFVCVIGERPDERRILGAICGDPADVTLQARASAACAQRLPTWAVPSVWVVLETLPTTRNGKVDVVALESAARPTISSVAASSVAASAVAASAVAADVTVAAWSDPHADMVDLVVAIWADVLGDDEIDATDGFFDLGGDSIGMLKVFHRLQERLPDHRFELIDLFTSPTPDTLARLLCEQAA